MDRLGKIADGGISLTGLHVQLGGGEPSTGFDRGIRSLVRNQKNHRQPGGIPSSCQIERDLQLHLLGGSPRTPLGNLLGSLREIESALARFCNHDRLIEKCIMGKGVIES